jgi:hypothetical protein
MKNQTKIILGIGVVATLGYIVWQQLNNKKNLVGVAPVEYNFKDFCSVTPEIVIEENKSLPTFGVPIQIKNR